MQKRRLEKLVPRVVEKERIVNGTNGSVFQNGEADGDGIGGTGFGEDELLPLPENTLTRNLGLDLIVVVTKVNKTIRRISVASVLLDHF